MKRIVLNGYFGLMFIVVTLTVLLFFPVVLAIYMGVLRRSLAWSIRRMIFFYGWTLVKVVSFFAPVEVEYRTSQVPIPAIIVANHNSAIEPFLLSTVLEDACFVTTWPFRIPIYGIFMQLAQYIDANHGWETVCQQSEKLLSEGTSIAIWPEGHRSRNGQLGKFKNGAFVVAAKSGKPLVPICFIGTRQLLPPGQRAFTPCRVKLIVLDPVYPDPANDFPYEVIRLRTTVKAMIEQTLREEASRDAAERPQTAKEAKNADQYPKCI